MMDTFRVGLCCGGCTGEVSRRVCAASLVVRRNGGLAAPDAEIGRKESPGDAMSALGRNRVLRRTWLVWTLACCFLQWLA
jgi:hypothetical protein